MSCAAVYVVAFSPVFIDSGWVVCTADHSATVTALAESILYEINMQWQTGLIGNGQYWMDFFFKLTQGPLRLTTCSDRYFQYLINHELVIRGTQKPKYVHVVSCPISPASIARRPHARI